MQKTTQKTTLKKNNLQVFHKAGKKSVAKWLFAHNNSTINSAVFSVVLFCTLVLALAGCGFKTAPKAQSTPSSQITIKILSHYWIGKDFVILWQTNTQVDEIQLVLITQNEQCSSCDDKRTLLLQQNGQQTLYLGQPIAQSTNATIRTLSDRINILRLKQWQVNKTDQLLLEAQNANQVVAWKYIAVGFQPIPAPQIVVEKMQESEQGMQYFLRWQPWGQQVTLDIFKTAKSENKILFFEQNSEIPFYKISTNFSQATVLSVAKTFYARFQDHQGNLSELSNPIP